MALSDGHQRGSLRLSPLACCRAAPRFSVAGGKRPFLCPAAVRGGHSSRPPNWPAPLRASVLQTTLLLGGGGGGVPATLTGASVTAAPRPQPLPVTADAAVRAKDDHLSVARAAPSPTRRESTPASVAPRSVDAPKAALAAGELMTLAPLRSATSISTACARPTTWLGFRSAPTSLAASPAAAVSAQAAATVAPPPPHPCMSVGCRRCRLPRIRAEPMFLLSDSDECGAAASATTDTTTSSLSYGPHAPTAGGPYVPRTRRRVLRPKVFSSPAAAAVAVAPPAGGLARRRTGPTSAARRSWPTSCGCLQLRLSDLSVRAATCAPRTLP